MATKTTQDSNQFEIDVSRIRDQARKHMEDGAVTDGNTIDVKRLIEVLNEVVATEIVCYLRYTRHFYAASGLSAGAVAAEFLEHAGQELDHANRIAARITQLQGLPDFNPDVLTARSHAEYVEGHDLLDMVREDLVAERIAIASYTEIAQWLGDKDPTTRNLMESILAVEEEHADDLLSILQEMT